MRQARLSDLANDPRLIQAAEQIIAQGSCMVSKPVRAGMTTSTILACERKGLSVLVLAPTRRILLETVANAACNVVRIPGNAECPLVEPDLQKNLILRQLPIPLPKCEECEGAAWCEVLAILRAKDPQVMGLTYAKIEALMLSRGKIAKDILKKISAADVILLDESHELALPKTVSVNVFTSLIIPEEYKSLTMVYQDWLIFCQNHCEIIKELMQLAEQGHSSQHLSRSASNYQFLEWKSLKAAWSELRKMAVRHDLPDDQILQLRDIISILATAQVSVSYMSEQEGESGAIYVSSGEVRIFRALNEYLTRYASRARTLFVSGTNFEPFPGYFSQMAGREIKNVVFPDIRNATKMMTLIPDRWKLTSRNFTDKLPSILQTIKAIHEREKQPIYLLAPNGRKAKWLQKELATLGLKSVFVDYYRSDHSLGVARSERVCITVGMAETPANSCDALAHGKDSAERWEYSRRLRRQGVDAATWQAVNRVRDPAGKVESRVYFIGCRADQIRKVATWGTNRQTIITEIKETKSSKGEVIRTPEFEIKVDEELELPKIYGEDKNSSKSERRTVKDYIKKIELYDVNLINSENHDISSIHNVNRENVAKLGIYNFPTNESEIDTTAKGLMELFVNRSDCYAKQYQNAKTGDWKFFKVNGTLDDDKIKQHIAGEQTLGAYEVGLDDMVKWCCDDIDSHNGETDAREKVGRLVDTCRTYSIPHMLEASGSPDSYHLWIPLSNTRTSNAFRFIRQLNAEAKVNCECYPKQKSILDKHGGIDKHGKYGNLLKLPVCLHNKTGARSGFLDADTFEPIMGGITHPGLVHLLEIPDLSGQAAEGMPKVSVPKGRVHHRCNTELDYCMQRALAENIPLTGSEGHHLRLAMAIKANKIGMDAEVTARLFQRQKDYDHDFSLNKVLETWSYNYSPWGCSALRDKCGNLVQAYCPMCPFNSAVGEKATA
jgi:hypothetical protein